MVRRTAFGPRLLPPLGLLLALRMLTACSDEPTGNVDVGADSDGDVGADSDVGDVGGDSEDDDRDRGGDTEDDVVVDDEAVGELVDALSSFFGRCHTIRLPGSGTPYRVGTFAAEAEPVLTAALTVDAAGYRPGVEDAIDIIVANPNIVIDWSELPACLTLLEGDDCSISFLHGPFASTSWLYRRGDACSRLFRGVLSENDTCALHECSPGLVCVGAGFSGDDCGTCLPTIAEDGDCTEALEQCEAGTFCRQGVCGALREPDPPLPPVNEGDLCPLDGCDGPNTGLACVGEPGTCQPITLVAEGELCDSESLGDTALHCRDSATIFYCNTDDGLPGSCERRPGPGEPCAQSGATCDRTRAICDAEGRDCVTAGVRGETCDPSIESSCAIGFSCADGECVDDFVFRQLETKTCEAAQP